MKLVKKINFFLSLCLIQGALSVQVQAGCFSCLQESDAVLLERGDHIKKFYRKFNFSAPFNFIDLGRPATSPSSQGQSGNEGIRWNPSAAATDRQDGENHDYTFVAIIRNSNFQALARKMHVEFSNLSTALGEHRYLLILYGNLLQEKEEVNFLSKTGALLVNGHVPESWASQSQTSPKELLPLYKILTGGFKGEGRDRNSTNSVNIQGGDVGKTVRVAGFMTGWRNYNVGDPIP